MKKVAVLVADVGGAAHYHVGDEAILTARLTWLRREFPEVEAVAVSEDAAFTTRQHGVRSIAEPKLPGWADRAWVYRWRVPSLTARFLEFRCRLGAPELGLVLNEIKNAAVLLICGGGNLTSTYGRLLRFRSLLAGYAVACGVPVVVTGQQIGPALTPDDAGILRDWLPHAELVGVRDEDISVRLGRELGVEEGRLAVTGDDAIGLEAVPVSIRWPSAFELRPVIGLSLHNPGSAGQRAEWVESFKAWLIPWLRVCDARILILPHLRADVVHRCDVQLAQELLVGSGLDDRTRWIEGAEFRDGTIKHLTGLCDFVVTTRYHGAVFALTNGVPVMALSFDDYTDSKFNGLFRYFGLDWRARRLPDSAVREDLPAAWKRRTELAAQLAPAMRAAVLKHEKAQLKVRAVMGRYL